MKTDTSENFRALRERIKNAADIPALERLDRSATRVYNAGQLSAKELQKLYVYIMERWAKMEIDFSS